MLMNILFVRKAKIYPAALAKPAPVVLVFALNTYKIFKISVSNNYKESSTLSPFSTLSVLPPTAFNSPVLQRYVCP